MASKHSDTDKDNAIQPQMSAQVVADDGIDNGKADASEANDAAALFLSSVGPFPPMTPEEEKKLVRKIDRWMIPLVADQNAHILFAVPC
jgi:hypothetical protein